MFEVDQNEFSSMRIKEVALPHNGKSDFKRNEVQNLFLSTSLKNGDLVVESEKEKKVLQEHLCNFFGIQGEPVKQSTSRVEVVDMAEVKIPKQGNYKSKMRQS